MKLVDGRGVYHPRSHCAFCGAHGSRVELRLSPIHQTFSLGNVCVDVVGCLRRQRLARDRARMAA